jgi:hypothetical protein
MPRFRILSEDGRSIRVEDTVTGHHLNAVRVELMAVGGEPLRVVLELAGDDFALDIAAGEMIGPPSQDDDEPADERPQKPRTLS